MPIDTPQEELRRQNVADILNLILRKSPISRAIISHETGLSAQTVSVIVRNLVECGLIVETGIDWNGSVGRQPINLDIRGDGAYALGFNIERDRLTKVLVNLKGEMIHRDFDNINPGDTPDATLERMIQYAEWIMYRSEFAYTASKLSGIGIGTPGPIDYARGVVISPPNFSSWSQISVRDYLKEKLNLPVVFDNSSTVAAIGELWRGRWSENSFLYCHWGIGIGGGLILHGVPYRGMSGNTMEIGHMVVVNDGAMCHCGQHGCLEMYSAIPAILRDASRLGDYRNWRTFVQHVNMTPGLHRVLVRAAEFLGQALVSVLNIVDVDLVIIGGHHFQEVQKFFMPVLTEIIETTSFRREVAKVSVMPSSLEEEAGAIGAALQVFQEVLLKTGVTRNPSRYR